MVVLLSTAPASECVDSGDTTWVLLSTILVLGMMPALGFFEAGLLRRKNTLSILTEVFVGLAFMQCMWYLFGFSLVYGEDQWGIIGDLQYCLFNGLGEVCLDDAPKIPGLAFASFQSMFASVTPLLMTGAVAERMKFRSFLIFIMLWELIVYYPLAHWVWGGGFLDNLGVLDFAGGIVIHASSGAASLVLAIGTFIIIWSTFTKQGSVLGQRIDFHKHHGESPPHNIPLAAIGTSLLWMGWYGFNAGSALTAGPVAAYAISATTIASCVGVVMWAGLSVIRYKHVHTVAVLNGAIAGMAGITPASGYIQSYYVAPTAVAIVLGAFLGIYVIKEKLKIDDALDVSSVHGITGIIGALAIGFFSDTNVNPAGADGWVNGNFRQVWVQLVGVSVAVVWSSIITFALAYSLSWINFFALTVDSDIEEFGLDHYYHGDVAYLDLETKRDGDEEENTSIMPSITVQTSDGDESTGLLTSGKRKRVLSARHAAMAGEVHV